MFFDDIVESPVDSDFHHLGTLLENFWLDGEPVVLANSWKEWEGVEWLAFFYHRIYNQWWNQIKKLEIVLTNVIYMMILMI